MKAKLEHILMWNTKAAQQISENDKSLINFWLIFVLSFLFALASSAQTNLHDINYVATSSFVPTIKDAVKYNDMPEIKDSVKKISNINYGIQSEPMFPKYQVETIDAAKMQNEPLPKLYHSLLKVGYGPFYSMPYGEFWAGNTRNRDQSFGAHLKHFSSNTHLQDHGYGGFSDNNAEVFGKNFYRKHTLGGTLNYSRNVIHYYGYDSSLHQITDNDYTKQRYQLFEPKIRVQSHYTDSTRLNHDIGLSYYNLSNLHRESENNIQAGILASTFLNKEKLNVGLNTNYYNHKQSNDTINDLIVNLSPSFEAAGKKWNAEVGLIATLDAFRDTTKFYVYPKLNVQYDVFEHIIIPYASITGGLIKNSMRSLTNENPFVDTTLNYKNTNNKYNFAIGLKGNLSSNTSYDARVTYGQYDNLHFYSINYKSNIQLYNQFQVIYDHASLLNIHGSLSYKHKEKINIIGKGNYYIYSPENLSKAYHKPDFDVTLSGIYNLKSKFILKADLFVMGQQWALSVPKSDTSSVLKDVQIKGWLDASLELEYRYSKMMSFFIRANNIANQRYYRWENYPTQRFNFMFGLTFIPF
ncbi:MAG: hypothetical protein IPM51_13570 [Sphingobacteriaceae bacterium]|nr:hypothetical protein [Sphingobacteriaceae bacterium]